MADSDSSVHLLGWGALADKGLASENPSFPLALDDWPDDTRVDVVCGKAFALILCGSFVRLHLLISSPLSLCLFLLRPLQSLLSLRCKALTRLAVEHARSQRRSVLGGKRAERRAGARQLHDKSRLL